MSESIKHECGIAVIRLLKPLEYYAEKYGTPFYGLNKLLLLMQKQINRGQDGAGIATIKLDMPPGTRYISRKRNNDADPVRNLFEEVHTRLNEIPADKMKDISWLKENMPYTGEVLLGHLRYGTHGGNSIEQCHPFLRQSNWMTRCLVLAGNFNMTNVNELFSHLVELGQHPKEASDTVTVMEKIGHFLDEEVQSLFKFFKTEGLSNVEITKRVAENIDLKKILSRSARKFDGGYVMAGILGHGDAFVMRDPNGIRPAYYYQDDEVAVVASERPAIMSAFDINYRHINELNPGHALIIRKNGVVMEEAIMPAVMRKSCSFERIYFSRGNDREIYTERKRLGELLAQPILNAVNQDFDNTVFSYIPNTAESAFYGLMKGVDDAFNKIKQQEILALMGNGVAPDPVAVERILDRKPRFEKLVNKDVKLRTFISDDSSRSDLVANVYDVTYGIVRDFVDTLVLLDDSIVRGTTLERSVLRITARLKPKKIMIVSSAPQIRYPDCYGIDMSKLREFVAFQAAVELLKERGMEHILQEVYERCKISMTIPIDEVENEVKAVYAPFTDDEISKKIAQIVRPVDILPEVEVLYQTIDSLHQACPNHLGDWYFSGNYPTHGGNRVANTAFIYYMEGVDKRAY